MVNLGSAQTPTQQQWQPVECTHTQIGGAHTHTSKQLVEQYPFRRHLRAMIFHTDGEAAGVG